MFWEGFKIFGTIALVTIIIGIIVYALLGWWAVAILALLVAIPIIVETKKSRNQRQLEETEQQRKEIAERRKADEAHRLAEEARKKAETDRLARESEKIKLYQEIEAERLAREERDKKYAEARKAMLEEKQKAFLEELQSIPSVPIVLSKEKYTKRALSSMPEIKFTNITKRTNPLSFTNFVVIDVETTGLARTSKIIELSAIRFEAFSPVEKFSVLVNPECPIPQDATKINGITDEMVEDAPKFWEVIPAFQTFVGSLPIVGHNLAFDLEFLHIYGFDLNNLKQRFYDTLQISKSILVRANNNYSNNYDVDDYKLGTLCEYYKIFTVNAHRSASDCLATGKLFEKIAHIKMQ